MRQQNLPALQGGLSLGQVGLEHTTHGL